MFEKLLGSLGLGNTGIGDLLGGMGSMFGNEGFKNLLGGGLGIYNAMQAGDMMDFQKDMLKRNEARNQDIFNREKADEQARQALNF